MHYSPKIKTESLKYGREAMALIGFAYDTFKNFYEWEITHTGTLHHVQVTASAEKFSPINYKSGQIHASVRNFGFYTSGTCDHEVEITYRDETGYYSMVMLIALDSKWAHAASVEYTEAANASSYMMNVTHNLAKSVLSSFAFHNGIPDQDTEWDSKAQEFFGSEGTN